MGLLTLLTLRQNLSRILTNAEMDGNFSTLANAIDAVAGRNRIINGGFNINQRVVSGTVTLAAGAYGHDRWKAGASGCTYTFASSNGLTTLTITAGSLQQVIEDVNVPTGINTLVMSWTGTAQGKIGAGSNGTSGVTASVSGGANLTVEFGTGTLAKVQLEVGSVPTAFEMRFQGTELSLCQRYFEKSNLIDVAPGTATASGALHVKTQATDSYYVFTPVWFKVTKRALPTFTAYSAGTGAAGFARNVSNNTEIPVLQDAIGDNSAGFYVNNTSVVAFSEMSLHWTASAEL